MRRVRIQTSNNNKLQKLEDALVEQMLSGLTGLTMGDMANFVDTGDMGNMGDKDDRGNIGDKGDMVDIVTW